MDVYAEAGGFELDSSFSDGVSSDVYSFSSTSLSDVNEAKENDEVCDW